MMYTKLLIVLLLIFTAGAAVALDLHVVSNGNDTNPGTEAAPFATLEHARDAIRDIKKTSGLPDGGVTVWIHGGDYLLANSFTLSELDSGTVERPIRYRAFANTTPRLIGGKTLPMSAFVEVTKSDVLARIPETARKNVRCADLASLGIQPYGAFPDGFEIAPPVSELFFNDERMTLARWPNEGWAEIAKVIESGPAPWRKYESDKPGVFEYSGDAPLRWTSASDVWVEGYWCFDWACETVRVKSIDTATRQITLAKPHVYGIGSGNPAPRRYRVINLLEELDQPGEYYLDRKNNLLYFWPPTLTPEGTTQATARIVLSTLPEPVIQMDNVSHVFLTGLIVESCVGNGIQMKGGSDNRIAACCVRNTGQNGIVVDGGEHHVVVACNIYDTGMGGVVMSGGERKTLHPSRHEIVNNDIHHISRRMRTHAYNVHLSGVGIRLAHNLLRDAPHQGIGLAGNDHIIEYNEIHHVGMESDDCGAFYMGRNPSERGSVLRYNFWHDIGSKMAHGSCAVYFDDGSGGQTVFGNVFYKAAGGQFGAVFMHGGHDNLIDNNIFVNCKKAIGGVPWSEKMWKEWLDGALWQSKLLEEVDIRKAPYLERYPALQGFMESDKKLRLNQARRNLAVNCEGLVSGHFEVRDCVTTNADPGFVNAEALNFTLRDDAEVLKHIPDFEQIPFERIGLYKDDLRTALPTRDVRACPPNE